MQQECVFNVFEKLFPLIYTNLVQFMEPKMDVSSFVISVYNSRLCKSHKTGCESSPGLWKFQNFQN